MANGAEFYSVKRGGGLWSFSAHAAFPPIVAAWFAALLGGASLMLPADLVEHALRAGGVTAAATPLGLGARATIAMAAAFLGAALGLSLAYRVRQAERTEAEPQSLAQMLPRCRPIDVAEDLGEDGISAMEWADPVVEDSAVDAEPAAAMDQQQAADAASGGQPLSREPLEALGLMQLTARLGTSLNARRAQMAAKRPAARVARPPSPTGIDAREIPDGDDAAQAIAEFFAARQA